MQITLGMYGEGDFFTLKGVVEDMLDSLGLGGTSEYTPTSENIHSYTQEELQV